MAEHRACLRDTGLIWRKLLPVAGALLFLAACADTATVANAPVRVVTPAFDGSATFVPEMSPLPQWSAAIARHRQELQAGKEIPAEWRRLVDELKGLSLGQKIRRVNAEINRHPYVPSDMNWGRPDYWETPFEFLTRNGQCQDYATTKYFLLRAAGVPAGELRIVIVQDSETRLAHAVVIVDPNGAALLLDNQIARVTPFAAARRYRPLYAINEDGWWLPKASTVQMAGAYTSAY